MENEIIKLVMKELKREDIGFKLCNGDIGHFNLYKDGKYIMSYWCFSNKYHIPNGNLKGTCGISECIKMYKEQIKEREIKMKEKSIEELEKESAEIRLKVDKAMEKSMKEMRRADIFFTIIQVGLLVLLIVSICAIINQMRIDSQILETYDSCVNVNGERYCRVEE